MKKHLSTIILCLVFFVGLSVLLYPTLSDYYNSFHASRAVATYEQSLENLSTDNTAELLAAADAFNRALPTPQTLINGDPQGQEYQNLLNVDGTGMMGYITIKKIGVELPIYHGTSDAVLASGTGHLEGTSLPVGGAGTHTVITGHRGLPSAKLFTNLDQLELGDTFTLTVLNQVLTYEVDNIAIVLPTDMQLLNLTPGQDYCTLVTCTPYGVNTHRLLVRGKRTETQTELRVTADAVQIDPVMVAPAVAAPMLLILLLVLLFGSPRRPKQNPNSVEKREDPQ